MRNNIPDPPSDSYWDASPLLERVLRQKLSPEDFEWAEPQLEAMGETSATVVAPLSAIADRESPRLVTHTPVGERINRVDYHPAYREMEKVAYGSGMVAIKYDQELVESRGSALQLVSFGLGYLFAMTEMGLYCPLCMTDGVARVLSHHGSDEQIANVIPRLASRELDSLWTGGMFLTERVGGSDVGASETVAKQSAMGWTLTGHKWFCSNVDAEAVLVTARPEGEQSGTRGLKTYLLLTEGNPGVRIERIKEKLGVRSMPTGEVQLTDAPVEEIGGFAPMTEMLNLSRLYNAVASVAVIGRAIHEARSYIGQRTAFGKKIIDHPLAEETLSDLDAEHLGAMLLTFEVIDLLGRSDRGEAEASRLVRMLTPMVKAVTGKLAVPCVSECMELIGGNGYIEESPLPRLLRDAQVLPIWEGTTNVLVLDTVRAARKERGHELLLERIARLFPDEASRLESELGTLQERDARRWVDRLARAFEQTLLLDFGAEAAAARLANRPLGLIPGAKM